MPRTPTTDQLADMLAEMREAIDDIERGARIEITDENGRPNGYARTPSGSGLLLMLSAARRDGYRTSCRLDHGQPASVLDDEGVPMPPISDPTGEVASETHKVVDPIRIHGESMLRGVAGALGDLRLARGALIRSSQYAREPVEPGCSVHEKIGEWVPVEHLGRCRWCYDFWRANKEDPPKDLLEARAQGRRITESMVRQALAKPKGRRR